MKSLIYICLLISNLAIGQLVTMNEPEIDKYIKELEKFNNKGKLLKICYPQMSPCGGSVCGYYLNGNVVIIDATYGAMLGFATYKYYFKDNILVKIVNHQHSAEWDKYYAKYPSETYEFDSKKITYSDTIFTVYLSPNSSIYKTSKGKIVSNTIENDYINMLKDCGQEMKEELQYVINAVDSLKFIKKMPKKEVPTDCGDSMYWNIVFLNLNVIELLIDKLNDTTPTMLNYDSNDLVPISAIAFEAINDIIHNIPICELLDLPPKQNLENKYSYEQFINLDIIERERLIIRIKKWYKKNKDDLIWIRCNEHFYSDCYEINNIEGYYQPKTIKKNRKL